jgi:hypothetical protein
MTYNEFTKKFIESQDWVRYKQYETDFKGKR